VFGPPWHSERVRLLLVEDEPRMAAALVRGLGAEGYVVDHVADGPGGLEAARFGAYDVVVLDVMLPGMSGYTVVRHLREERNWVPVLLLSAKDGEHDVADGLDYGADDYLTKPFSFVVLLARLRSLLRREVGPRPVVLEAGGISLDPSTRRVRVDGGDVELSPREFLLLEQLLRAAPALVSKETLLDGVWAGGDDPNVVEVYVGYLRRKLGRERIETVRGAGYRVAS
jgi:DNA-binding response OmpR family regulator